MSKKPIIVYSMASFGMGHATRAVPIIDRLQKEYEVHIFSSRNAKNWLGKKYPHIHENLTLSGVKFNGKVNLKLAMLKAWLNLPRTIFYIVKIFIFIMKNRPVAVFSDFELHASYGAKLANYFYKLPIIACDNFMSILYSEVPFHLNEKERALYKHWQKNIKIITSQADHFLVHKYLETKLSHPKAQYVPIPIRDNFLEAAKNTSEDGAIVISTGSLFNEELIKVLKETPFEYIFFGHVGSFKDQNIQFHNFNDEFYLESLQKAPFAIVSGNSSAIDALALKKPIFHMPHPGHFEQFFCAKSYEYLGVGVYSLKPEPQDLISFHKNLEQFREKVNQLDYFDNEKLFSIIMKNIKKG